MQPGIHTLQKIADALGVTVDHLVSNPYRDVNKNKILELRSYVLKMNSRQIEKFSELIDYMLKEDIHISRNK